MKRVFILIILCFGLLRFSYGAVYYVSTSGNDASGNGSSSNPWKTLKFAVSKVPGNQGHTIKLSSGTFVEQGPIDVPIGVNIEGSGTSTVLKAASSFYYNPAKPGYGENKYLIRFISPSPTNGGQSIKNLTINGDGKKLHGGILFQNRDNIRAEGLRLEYINFNGLWLWKSRNSRITNCEFLNCAWASYDWCVGALIIGDLENVEIDNIKIDEGWGYGIKALHFGTASRGRLTNVKIHDSRISVNPYGVWHDNRHPNMTLELWNTYLDNVEIYNNYFDNNVSLVSEFSDQTGKIRLHHNTFDMASRSKGTGYGVELTVNNVEIDNNFFNTGTNGIANWGTSPRKDWNIHHNVFYGFHGINPSQAVRLQSTLANLKFINNTFECIGTTTENVIGLYGAGQSQNFDIRNNLLINSNSKYDLYPNKFIQLQNGASISGLKVSNNFFYKLETGNVPGTYSNNTIGVNPQINASGNRPDPFYRPKPGSPIIDMGVNTGYSYSGSAPDLGAYEYGTTYTGTVTTPTPPSTNTSNIVVRARGTSGSESIQLQVNNTTIATWTMTTTMTNYTATTSLTGNIYVRYTNDASGRDVQVDYIQVNGSTRQAENQTNTGLCGGSGKSEWMYCNGYIDFGAVSSGTSTSVVASAPTSGSNSIVVRARGTSGSESIQLQVNNTTIATWTMTTTMTNYTATTSLTGNIYVRYTNDASGRDVQVDYIQVNGSTRQAENQTNTGLCGGSGKSEWMYCNGYIDFGAVSSGSQSARLRTDSEELEDIDELFVVEQPLLRFNNPVNDGVLRMEVSNEVSEIRILDLKGRTMKVFAQQHEGQVNENIGLPPGMYVIQPLQNGEKKKPQRLIVK